MRSTDSRSAGAEILTRAPAQNRACAAWARRDCFCPRTGGDPAIAMATEGTSATTPFGAGAGNRFCPRPTLGRRVGRRLLRHDSERRGVLETAPCHPLRQPARDLESCSRLPNLACDRKSYLVRGAAAVSKRTARPHRCSVGSSAGRAWFRSRSWGDRRHRSQGGDVDVTADRPDLVREGGEVDVGRESHRG
jgi:hypothetical protein